MVRGGFAGRLVGELGLALVGPGRGVDSRVAEERAVGVRLGATGREDETPATDDEAAGVDGDNGVPRDDWSLEAGVIGGGMTHPLGGCGSATDGGSAVGQSTATMRLATAPAVPTNRSR
ncbi:hypothetical protein [Micromonospora phaseoli]|uniref:hypothetical protein n=1 Tax=Micromonospora phaseoli TaxID=1144548 RepID=UPI000B889897|nr:hypothetical protein [Micromonospora phaseoli]GIJ75988.1 hypothetical protein Xph01_04200 [Micromonospora phaseoli]